MAIRRGRKKEAIKMKLRECRRVVVDTTGLFTARLRSMVIAGKDSTVSSATTWGKVFNGGLVWVEKCV